MADKEVNTSGGTFVGQDVNTDSGDFVGRDKTNTTNNISSTTTTSATHLSGNLIVAITAVLVVGIIGTIAILRDGLIGPPGAWSSGTTPKIVTVAGETTKSPPGVLTASSPDEIETSAVSAIQTACQRDKSVVTGFQERNGEVIIDAKNCSYRITGSGAAAQHYWEERAMDGSCSGKALRSYPNNRINTYLETIGPAALYNIKFHTTGKFYIYIRGRAGGESYTENDRAVNDSILIGIKQSNTNVEPELITTPGTGSTPGTGLAGFARNQFSWQMQHDNTDTVVNIPQAGEYTLYVWMREDGVIIDRIWLSRTRQLPEECKQIESVSS